MMNLPPTVAHADRQRILEHRSHELRRLQEVQSAGPLDSYDHFRIDTYDQRSYSKRAIV